MEAYILARGQALILIMKNSILLLFPSFLFLPMFFSYCLLINPHSFSHLQYMG